MLACDEERLFVQTPAGRVALPFPVRVLGAGKASARMAAAVEELAPAEVVRGVVIAPRGTTNELSALELWFGGHPLPNSESLRASRRLLQEARRRDAASTLFLLSGGASSLLVAPRPPLRLSEKQRVNELLLASGASVSEINAVRKHLSLVKGGQLLRILDGLVATIAISDVPGDDPTVIGSAPTYFDPTTFAEALRIVEGYGLQDQLPPAACRILADGAEGRLPETVKPGDPEAARICYVIAATNHDAQQAVLEQARRWGWNGEAYPQLLSGETRIVARDFAAFILRRCKDLPSAGPPWVVVAGGETTVTVRGSGSGGRNQEFALALVEELRDAPVCVLSAGTDGIDGPTPAAGAFVSGTTAHQASRLGLDPAAFLENNDSFLFFSRLGDSFVTGPTGTNVMDLKIAILHPRAS